MGTPRPRRARPLSAARLPAAPSPPQWHLELERVVPKLLERQRDGRKPGGGSGGGAYGASDWSARLAQTQAYAATMGGLVAPKGGGVDADVRGVCGQIGALGDGARTGHSAIVSGEATINRAFDTLAAQHKAAAVEAAALREREAELQARVSEQSTSLEALATQVMAPACHEEEGRRVNASSSRKDRPRVAVPQVLLRRPLERGRSPVWIVAARMPSRRRCRHRSDILAARLKRRCPV